MRITVKTNIDEMFGQLEQALTKAVAIAVPRALNELRDQAETAAKRKTAEIYRIGVRGLDPYISTKYAKADDFESSITVKGAGFPLAAMSPRQTKAGVSVLVKGRRFIIPHTFMAKMRNGHVGVFARGAYGGKGLTVLTDNFGRFQFGRRTRITRPRSRRSSLPINEMFTFGPVEAFSNADVTEAMQDRIAEQAVKVLARNIAYARRVA